MTQQAPAITSPIRILNVAANYISLDWDAVSVGYTYLIYRKPSIDAWDYGLTQTLKDAGDLYAPTEYFDSGLDPVTSYDYAISVIGPGLIESEKTFLNNITTFEINSYSIQTATNVQLYDTFLASRFENDDQTTTVAPTKLALMRPSYVFDREHANIADIDVAPHLMVAGNTVQIWGRAPNGCGGFGCSGQAPPEAMGVTPKTG